MPYDGNGNYTLPSVYKATPGTEIMTTQHNMPLEDIQAALNAVLLRNGSVPVTSNWNMGSNRITFLADGVANTDAANVGQLKALLNNTALTGVTTVPAVTDWTAYQPVGAKDADARYVRLTGDNVTSGNQTNIGTWTNAGTANVNGALNITGSITVQVASSTQKITLRRGSTFGGINSYDGTNWHYLYVNDDDTVDTAKGTLAFDKDKPNLVGDNAFKGSQTITGNVAVGVGGGWSSATSNGVTQRWSNGHISFGSADGPLTTYTGCLQVTSTAYNDASDQSGMNLFGFNYAGVRTDYTFAWNGRISTPLGVVALTSQLPFLDQNLRWQVVRLRKTSGSKSSHTFPTAYKAGTIPFVIPVGSTEITGSSSGYPAIWVNSDGSIAITNTGFELTWNTNNGTASAADSWLTYLVGGYFS